MLEVSIKGNSVVFDIDPSICTDGYPSPCNPHNSSSICYHLFPSSLPLEAKCLVDHEFPAEREEGSADGNPRNFVNCYIR